MSSDTVRVAWDQRASHPCLVFTFPEQLTWEVACDAIVEWRKAFYSKRGKPITIVWDCREMKGYDSKARREWQQTIEEMKGQIENIWLVSGSAFVRMGAMMMGKAISLPIRTTDSMRGIAA